MKSALFVDFDNVYSGLRRLDQETADQFARNPTVWMNWLIRSLELPEPVPPGARRRVLVRRCYLNPQAYQRFRPSFNLAGFEIIDCPALTSEGKTSTDIHMVLDIVDLLQHETHYDEFIVFSADADFTPVLRKLRRWDRRTTVLAIGFPSAAYRASADLLIDQDDFVRNALSFDESGTILDPLQHAQPAPPTANDSNGSVTVPQDTLVEAIKGEIARTAYPVPCARLAALLINLDSNLAADWGGKGTFRRFVETLDLSPIAFDWRDSGGVAYDPGQSGGSATRPSSAADEWADLSLYRIAKQIHDVTDVPLLTPDRYRKLIAAIASDVAEHPFSLIETGKRVRDRCKESGQPVSRADVNHVLRGMIMRGHAFDDGPNDAATLARKLANNVRSLCLREQLILDEATDKAIRDWIGSR